MHLGFLNRNPKPFADIALSPNTERFPQRGLSGVRLHTQLMEALFPLGSYQDSSHSRLPSNETATFSQFRSSNSSCWVFPWGELKRLLSSLMFWFQYPFPTSKLPATHRCSFPGSVAMCSVQDMRFYSPRHLDSRVNSLSTCLSNIFFSW